MIIQKDYFTILYDLIEVFNGERQYSKSLDDNIKNEKEVVNMEIAMSQAFKTIRNESWKEGIQIVEQID